MKAEDSFDIWSSARAQAAALARRDISVRELVQLYRQRIEDFNPDLNAIVVCCLDRAEQRAAELDALPHGQSPAPLHGVPMTIKESLEVRGLQTTGGVIESNGRISEVDSPHVTSLKAAGMTLMGKTNIPTACSDLQSDSPVYGRTLNPWNAKRTPGGSSGGSAAAVAAGLTPLEIGTDIGGSVRVPASFCGIYGLRPSETAVPRWGDYPGNSASNPSSPMSVFGPLARTASDLELALDIISQSDPGENTAWSLHIPPARHEKLSDFRVGFLGDMSWVPLSGEVKAAQERIRKAVEARGSSIVDVDPEQMLNGSFRHHMDYSRLLMSIMTVDLSDEDRAAIIDLVQHRDGLREALHEALYSPPSVIFSWFARREEQRARYRALFQGIDVLVAPITLRTAFPHITEKRVVVDHYERSVDIDGVSYPYDLQVVYPGMTTFAGQPAVTFPAGRAADGLPVGLQAVGPYLEDRTSIRFAELIANETGGFTPPPGY
jgi:amidase